MRDALPVFCAPGRGETYEETMKGLVRRRGAEVSAVDFTPEFAHLLFSQQVELFQRIIAEEYWSRDALLLGRSFGAWILLNALMELQDEHPGTVILLAAVLGSSREGNKRMIAPRNRRFWGEAEKRAGPPARRFALIHSIDDNQCPFVLAVRLRQLWDIEVVRFTNGGHGLGARTQREAVADGIAQIWEVQ